MDRELVLHFYEFFFSIPFSPLLDRIVYTLVDFFPATFAAFSHFSVPKIVGFFVVVLSFTYFDFFSAVKRVQYRKRLRTFKMASSEHVNYVVDWPYLATPRLPISIRPELIIYCKKLNTLF